MPNFKGNLNQNQILLMTCIVIVIIQHCNSLRTRHYITISAMLSPKKSAWMRMFHNADEKSFLNVVGMTRDALTKLKLIIFEIQPPEFRRGRSADINEDTKLGLYLLCTGSTMRIKVLCLIFGVVPTTGINIINIMMDLIIKKLRKRKEAIESE